MTGGELTRSSNDYTIGYARARRDLGCRYTVGFYDRNPEPDKQHQVRIETRRKGVHLLYAARYTFPSEKERRKLGLEAAYLVPRQFDGGGLRAHLFPMQPEDSKRWSAVLAVDFPVPVPDAADASTREFGAVLRRGSKVVHTFNRSITLQRHVGDSEGDAPRVTFVEPLVLPPGRYSLTAVLADPGGEKPFGAATELTVPPIPKHTAILAGPILGRRRGNDVVVYGGGDARGATGDRVGDRAAFRPLLIDDVDRDEPLAALTQVCILGPRAKDGPWSLSRRLDTADGVSAGTLADLTMNASPGSGVQCERLFDELPVPRLKPGSYTFRAVLAEVGGYPAPSSEATVPFAVMASPATPAVSPSPPAPSH